VTFAVSQFRIQERNGGNQGLMRVHLDQLAAHAGKWLAWSPDGTRIVASSPDPEALDNLVRAAGEDPEQCLIEGIPDTDAVIGG